MYADWEDYERYGRGTLTFEAFERLAQKASDWIEYVTFDRSAPYRIGAKNRPITRMSERIMRCCIALVDYLDAASKFIMEGKGMVTEEQVATWRAKFAIPKHMSPDQEQQNMSEICQQWLTRPINLMYTGV